MKNNNHLIKNKVIRIILKVVLIIAVIVTLFILSAGALLTHTLIQGRADFSSLESPEKYGIYSETINLYTSDNFNIQAFDITVPDSKGYVIILSGIESPSVTAFFGYARMFSDLGYSSLLIEMRGHGASDGDKLMLSYTEQYDVDAAVEYIRNNQANSTNPIIIMGTSMGGTVAINSAAGNNEIDAVISQSAFSSWEKNLADQFEYYGVPSFISKSQIPFTRLYLRFRIGWSLVNNTPEKNMSRINDKPILLIHSKEDSQVRFNNFIRLKKTASDNLTTYIVDGDNHFILESDEEFEDPQLNEAYYSVIKDFLTKVSELK